MKRWSDTRLLLSGVAIIAALALLVLLTRNGDAPSSSRPRSDQAGGMLALWLWLERLGYTVEEVPSGGDLSPYSAIFALAARPDDMFQANTLAAWVGRGHTLIFAGEKAEAAWTLAPYEIELGEVLFDRAQVALASPTLRQPPVEQVNLNYACAVESNRADLVMHLTYNRQPVVASLNSGRGIVWVSGSLYPFTNRGLTDTGSAELILNMLNTVPAGTRIGFLQQSAANNEGAGGNSAGNPPPPQEDVETLSDWLFGSPPGWALLATIALTMLFLLMRGRRFGAAVPLPAERLLREPVEYIRAMGGLLRRSGQRGEMLQHYRQQFRRRLAKHYALDPSLSDADLVKQIQVRQPSVDQAALQNLLAQLGKSRVSEKELLTLVIRIEQWTKEL